MSSTPSLVGQYWYVAALGLALALVSYLLIARLAIDAAFGDRGDNPVFRGLRWLTSPFVGVVRAITPRVVPGLLVTACAIAWVLALRILLVQSLAAMARGGAFG